MLDLKEERKRVGLTQLAIAKKLGISESFYNQIENGKRRLTLKMALDIAAILKRTPNELFLPNDLAECQAPTGTES